MVEGKLRSRTKRRVYVKTPGGKNVIHYRDRKTSAPKCGGCREILKGIIRVKATLMKNVNKTSKTVSRPYGGNLCSKCMRKRIIEKWLK
ncbi:50S ribosomal protein L34e [Candidatus Woesearchaeota archaeon]|nr:50S ribosomal protein L34e [Candidatus Woesearchaeota archaeon]